MLYVKNYIRVIYRAHHLNMLQFTHYFCGIKTKYNNSYQMFHKNQHCLNRQITHD